MKQIALPYYNNFISSIRVQYSSLILAFIAGIFGPLGFAPFHLPGFIFLSLAMFYLLLLNNTIKQVFLIGFVYGMAYFGFGISWIILSVHDYGDLNYFLSGIITMVLILYLSLFPATVAYVFKKIKLKPNSLLTMIVFSVLWCLSELIRAHLFTGLPWLLIGTTQIDTPLRYLAPIIGVHGLSLLTAFGATLIVTAVHVDSYKRLMCIVTFVLLIISPSLLKNINWTQIDEKPISIAAVQANLSMRDKWDEKLFWQLLKLYAEAIDKLLGKELIILPESAIPLPASYLNEYLNTLNMKTQKAKSALLFGILQPADTEQTHFYNSIGSLGLANGEHTKSKLVPFGEYIPKPFMKVMRWLSFPDFNMVPGPGYQELIHVADHSIASLICYEIAYPSVLHSQLPTAEWIVSISDNGWFGRSLASYQQLQMAQFLSLLTGRFQILVNNDGLSSVINEKGEIINGLPPFSSGILEGEVYPAHGATPWVIWTEYPILLFCFLILCLGIHKSIAAEHKRSYP